MGRENKHRRALMGRGGNSVAGESMRAKIQDLGLAV